MTTPDPLFNRLHPVKTSSNAVSTATTLSLLQAAFPDPSTVQNIYTQKLDHRPLNLNPASDNLDARTLRRQKRQEKLKRKRKPKPLSAREKRELRIYDVPKDERIYDNFVLLNKLWNDYVLEIVPWKAKEPSTVTYGPTLLRADYDGAYMTVEDCRCKSRVGINGICIKETRNMFEIITKENRLLKIPKEKSLFRVKAERDGKEFEWRLWGDQVLTRSGERASRKFNGRSIRGKPLLEL